MVNNPFQLLQLMYHPSGCCFISYFKINTDNLSDPACCSSRSLGKVHRYQVNSHCKDWKLTSMQWFPGALPEVSFGILMIYPKKKCLSVRANKNLPVNKENLTFFFFFFQQHRATLKSSIDIWQNTRINWDNYQLCFLVKRDWAQH